MAMKSSSMMFVALALVVAMVSTAPKAEAQGSLTSIPKVSGYVNCTVNSTIPAPPFRGATVELLCPSSIITLIVKLGISITNIINGGFNITVLPSLSSFVSPRCKLVVTTPLVSCNATLPSTGFLVSPIVQTGTVTRTNLYIPTGFMYSLSTF